MPDGDLTAALDQIRERATRTDQVLALGGSYAEAAARSQTDVPRLLAAVEAVLKLGDRSGEARDPHLPGYVDVHMIREAITCALAGKDNSDA